MFTRTGPSAHDRGGNVQSHSDPIEPLLDRAHTALASLDPSGLGAEIPRLARFRDQLGWVGRWLSGTYSAPDDASGSRLWPSDVVLELRRLTHDLEHLLETFEDEDPIANAERIQAASLTFAIVGAAASEIERHSTPPASRGPEQVTR